MSKLLLFHFRTQLKTPHYTIDALANDISNGDARLLLAHPGTTVEKEIKTSVEPSLRRLNAVLKASKHHSTAYEIKESNVFRRLREDPKLVGLYNFEVILHELSRFKNYTCLDYHIQPVRDFTMYHIGLVFSRGSEYTEMFNQIITERMQYVAEQLNVPKLSAKCHDHVFPDDVDVSTSYSQLDFIALSGAFAVWAAVCAAGAVAFVGEVCAGRVKRCVQHTGHKKQMERKFIVHTNLCEYVIDDQQIYDELTSALARVERYRVG